MAASEFGDECHARPLHPGFDLVCLVRLKIQRRGAVHRLAGTASGQDRQGSEPLARQHEHGVDVFPLGQRPESIDRIGAEFAGGDFGPVGHRLAHRADLESVVQGPQCRAMAIFPGIS